MNKRRIFVFDTSRVYSKLIIKEFSFFFEVIASNDFRNVKKEHLLGVVLVIVIINSVEDVMAYVWLKANVDFVIIGLGIESLRTLFLNENIVLFDLVWTKKQIVSFLEGFFVLNRF